MEYRKLGNTDLEVSIICLGTMTWGQQNSEEEGHDQMDYALEKGINFFDTAEMYSIPPKSETQGSTERIVGSWFKKSSNREKIILASKVAGRGRMDWIRGNYLRARGVRPSAVRIVFFTGPKYFCSSRWIRLRARL